MKKTFAPRKETEDAHCMALMEWASYHPICKKFLFHIENERECTPAQGAKRKKMGVKPGVSDYFLPYPDHRNEFKGLWIEIKIPGRVLTPKQRSWLFDMQDLGFKAYVCYGVDHAIELIKKYLGEDKVDKNYSDYKQSDYKYISSDQADKIEIIWGWKSE